MFRHAPMKRLRWVLAIAAIALFAIGAWANRYGSLPPYTDASGRVVPGAVSEMRQLELGKYPQWVTIRGRIASAPILIWLSGGPGNDETFLLRRWNSVLEEHYLVTYWVQRGSGRSYSDALDRSTLHLDQFVADLDELVTYLTNRFGQRQVILIGHSWGTAIGVAYAKAHPERVAAYVGIGQMTDMAENERLGYEFAFSQAKEHGDKAALADLKRIGPPPYLVDAMLTQRKWVTAYGGGFHHPTPLTTLIWQSLETSRGAWMDLLKFSKGQEVSLHTIWPEIAKLNFMRDNRQFRVPIAIFTGRYDNYISADLALRYFTEIDAPRKRFVWFDQSAHSPHLEEPGKFNSALLETLAELTVSQN